MKQKDEIVNGMVQEKLVKQDRDGVEWHRKQKE